MTALLTCMSGNPNGRAWRNTGNNGLDDVLQASRTTHSPVACRIVPTYVYRFLDTDETIEVHQSFNDPTLTEATHPVSGETMAVKKVFLPVGVTFKGDGFYKTDSRSTKKSSDSKESDSSTSSDSGTSDSGKSDSGKSDSSKSDSGKSDSSKSDSGKSDSSGTASKSSDSSGSKSTSSTSSSSSTAD
jgi:predicted nucleic acid-binding Zn ribbon protein